MEVGRPGPAALRGQPTPNDGHYIKHVSGGSLPRRKNGVEVNELLPGVRHSLTDT